jgi:hypothetical protein
MARKTFEDLAKELGYSSFGLMKSELGNGNTKRGNSYSFVFGNKKKKSTSPTKDGGGDSISSDVIPFLNIIAKNSLALPGMARDMNVLRQNIVKLVKLKNAEAITKADKFFKTEDQREAELEEARKKETSPVQMDDKGKEKKGKKEKDEGTEGVAEYLWNLIKKILGVLFIGLGLAFTSAFDLGKLVDTIKEKFNPLPLIENLFDSIAKGWKEITETDIVKETLIKSVGKFLDFITGGLFGEKELRQSLNDLQEYIAPMIDVITETFKKIVGWLQDNIGWDPFTIPLSKINDIPLVGDALKKIGWGFSDVKVPGFRPFKKKGEEAPAPTGGVGAAPAPPPREDLKTAQTAQGDVVYDEMGNVVSGSPATGATPTKETGKRTQEGKVKRAPENVAKEAEKDKKSAVEFLKAQVGVVYDPNSPTKFIDVRTGNPVEENFVRDRIVDMKGNPDKILSLIKPAPTSVPSAPAQQSAATGAATTPPTGTGGGTAPTGGAMSGGAPSMESAPPSAPSGEELSQTSAQVAEGQRMDSAADAGTVIDAGTTNNNMSSSGKKPKQVADAYNTSFINSYYGKPA